MAWSVDTKCQWRGDDCKCWDDVYKPSDRPCFWQPPTLELLLFKRRPRFTSKKFCSRFRASRSKKNFWTIRVDLIKPTDVSEIFFNKFFSVASGCTLWQLASIFFCSDGIALQKKLRRVEKKQKRLIPNPHTHLNIFFGIRRRLGTQSELDR